MATPTTAQTAAVINSLRTTVSDEEFNLFLCAVERHHGADHLRAAHTLAHDLSMEASGAVKGDDGSWYRPEPYAVKGDMVAQWVGGMYRFYCTLAAWQYSPAARSGVALC
jgi:hypothetical protein